jgi:hypothetical protein
VARVLAELVALHPGLPVVFAGNRKLANVWALRFFEAVASHRASAPSQLYLDVAARFDATVREPGLDDRVRFAVLHELPEPFSFAELAARFDDTPAKRLRRVVDQLRREGRIERVGAGRGARWRRLPEVGSR